LDNITAAKLIAIELWEAGHTVICPHLNTYWALAECDIPQDEYVKRDLQIVERCDGVVMIPGWEQSDGAVTEYMFAKLKDIPVWEYPEIPDAS
jgi:hypothetical protein